MITALDLVRLAVCIVLVFLIIGSGRYGIAMAAPAPGEPVVLFNGKDLTNFYVFLNGRTRGEDPLGVFTVQDGLLRISGQEWGCITTDEEFENYHLVVEFRWGDATWAPRVENARDCGVLLHSVGEDGAFGGSWMYSIECQVIEGGTGDFIVVGDGSDHYALTSEVTADSHEGRWVHEPGGRPVTLHQGRVDWPGRDPNWQDVKGFRGTREAEHPAGEWNRYECIANGPCITLLLNGVVVNQCIDVRPRKGRIQIQSEGAELFIRRVELTPIQRSRRLIYNSDGDNMFIYKEPPMKLQDVFAYVDEIADAGITTLYISPNVGMPVHFPGRVNEMLGANASEEQAKAFADPASTRSASLERAVANLRSLVEQGYDPLGLIVDRAHERGMEVFISYRLNEVHAVEQEDSLLFSTFWKQHPEWRIGKAGDPLPELYKQILGPDTHPIVASWLPGGLNFAVPEVRAQRLAELRECCERYAIDGLDLDFQRFPMYFKPGEETQHIETMTAWMREVRGMTRSLSHERGRPIQLTARVMARPEQNQGIGIDPAAWAREGLTDFLTVSHYLRNDFALPINAYRQAMPPGYPLCASIEVAKDQDTYRRIARELWRDGVDGIMLFNFFTVRERGEEPPFGLIPEIMTP